jgi:hypothetical protein
VYNFVLLGQHPCCLWYYPRAKGLAMWVSWLWTHDVLTANSQSSYCRLLNAEMTCMYRVVYLLIICITWNKVKHQYSPKNYLNDSVMYTCSSQAKYEKKFRFTKENMVILVSHLTAYLQYTTHCSLKEKICIPFLH